MNWWCFKQGAPSVIYAYGTNQLKPGSDISYHSANRGTQKLNILNVINMNSPTPSDSEYIDFSIRNVYYILFCLMNFKI